MRNIGGVTLSIGLYVLAFALLIAPVAYFWPQYLESHPGVPDPMIRFPFDAGAAVAAILAALVAGMVFNTPRVRDFGLARRTGLPHLIAGALIGVGIVAAVLAVLHVNGALAITKEIALSAGTVFAVAMLGLFLNTIFQEVAFRGYIFGAISGRYGAVAATLVSSLLFVAVHAGVFSEPWPTNAIGALNLFLAGVLMSLAYLRTNSLWLPIGIHFAWNGMWTVLGLSVSGQSILGGSPMFELSGSPLLTGGAFGPEGSLPGLLGPVAGLVLVSLLFRRSARVAT